MGRKKQIEGIAETKGYRKHIALSAALSVSQRNVEIICLSGDIRASPVAAVRNEGIGKFMKALIGSRSVLMVTSLLGSLGPTFFLMSTPGNVLPLFLNNFIGTLFSSGAALSINNMQLSYSPDESRPSYIAVFACVTALAGTTLGSLTGGGVLEVWKDLGWFTGFFDRYKMLALVSSLLRFLSALMLVPRMTNDRESGTPKDVLSHLNPFRYFKNTKT